MATWLKDEEFYDEATGDRVVITTWKESQHRTAFLPATDNTTIKLFMRLYHTGGGNRWSSSTLDVHRVFTEVVSSC